MALHPDGRELDRRTFITLSAAGGLLTLSGCLSGTTWPDGSSDDDPPNSQTAGDLDSISDDSDAIDRFERRSSGDDWTVADGAYGIRIENTTDEDLPVTLRLDHDGDSVLDREVIIPAASELVIELSSGGTYDTAIEADGLESETTTTWSPDDCETGTTELTIGTGGIETDTSISC
ncbi:hypothetical protein [Natrialba asiatica]|uniref:Ig-like domain-containing protein n=1 Tax=Natrialba asiatica (strain ATCC 700177 / DSM 12278 / JCM 9576 / FERM P-10747 / NBRC 102637 / 172P1) TaxID=29540 RepID=M0ATD2_NATA1|nr:hypothetical protein [Natrialba asiatica]ELZ01810.1 hypothetical protein C481_09827 [Natrialba asiatica DSM 12278]